MFISPTQISNLSISESLPLVLLSHLLPVSPFFWICRSIPLCVSLHPLSNLQLSVVSSSGYIHAHSERFTHAGLLTYTHTHTHTQVAENRASGVEDGKCWKKCEGESVFVKEKREKDSLLYGLTAVKEEGRNQQETSVCVS